MGGGVFCWVFGCVCVCVWSLEDSQLPHHFSSSIRYAMVDKYWPCKFLSFLFLGYKMLCESEVLGNNVSSLPGLLPIFSRKLCSVFISSTLFWVWLMISFSTRWIRWLGFMQILFWWLSSSHEWMRQSSLSH